MQTVEMNEVSECCHKEIVTHHSREFPLGGVTWGINTKSPVCIGCGMETSPVYACGVCGVVGCNGLGGCEEELKPFKEIPCKLCLGNGYHYGFGEEGRSPDWCTSCGGIGVEFVTADISEVEE